MLMVYGGEKMKNSCDTFTSNDKEISVKAYLGNRHGVHTNKFPVRYEEIVDAPDDILFRTNSCIISSAYCRLEKMADKLAKNGETFDEVISKIKNGLLWKGRQCLCHSELATKECVETYLKYVKSSDIGIGIYNFDKFLEFQKEKTINSIVCIEEEQIYNEIISLQEISESTVLLNKIMLLDNSNFKKYALLLLKCIVYDIEDKHYLETKIHNKGELDALKVYRKITTPQI